ncbi:MAG: hypothetical protein IKP49_10685 [Treponema sp.]|nr:hypothetical protein [Treponema sp.]
MENKLKDVSLNGRLGYLIMCCEAYLKTKYPERDWTFVAERMWEATSCEYWNRWTDKYVGFIPCVLFEYAEYDKDDLEECYTKEQFETLKSLYSGITDGNEDDSNDEFAQIIRKPFDFCMVYEGTGIGDGSDGYALIDETEKILTENGIPLPDYHKVEFSSYTELNGWENDFDGRPLSVILNKTELYRMEER